MPVGDVKHGQPAKNAADENTVLIKVDDLINAAMGPDDKNRVDFKLLRNVLHILARQMRILEQTVEIRLDDEFSGQADDSSEDES